MMRPTLNPTPIVETATRRLLWRAVAFTLALFLVGLLT